MAITVSLGFEPLWYLPNLTGLPNSGGYILSFDSLNPTVPKDIYLDPAGEAPAPMPLTFGMNGLINQALYFKFDDANPSSLYYLKFYDKDNNPIGEVNNYLPGSGSGGGSPITNIIVDNIISNNVFWRNIGTVINPGLFTTLAPSSHAGIVKNLTAIEGPVGPDICFIKQLIGGSDTISFPAFTLGSNPLASDTTPEFYFNYECGSVVSQSYKILQIPLTSKVINLSGQQVTIGFWGICTSGSNIVNVRIRSYYGQGTGLGVPSSDKYSSVQTFNLTNSWVKYYFTTNIFNSSGQTLGNCGDDANFLQILLPSSLTTNIGITKPTMYLGNLQIGNTADYTTYDQIDSVSDDFRTGDTRVSLNSFYPYGWVPMNDGTIGSEASGALIRANIDTFPLYDLIWNSVSNTYAPVIGGRGSNSVNDFTANKPIYLTKSLGRVFAGTSPISITQNFTASAPQTITFNNTDKTGNITDTSWLVNGVSIILVKGSGGTLPTGLAYDTLYYATNITSVTKFQIASTYANALSGMFISFTGAGGGTNTIQISGLKVSSSASFFSGLPVSLSVSGGGALPGGLVSGTTYYVIQYNSTLVGLTDAPSDVPLGNALPVTSSGSPITTLNSPAQVLGQYSGDETNAIIENNLPPFTANLTAVNPVVESGSRATVIEPAGPSSGFTQSVKITPTAMPQNVPFNVLQPTTYMNVYIKL